MALPGQSGDHLQQDHRRELHDLYEPLSADSPPPSAPAASDTGTAVVPPDAFGDDCTYVDSSSVEGSLSEQRSSYTVPAHSADGCCKACVADLTCGGAMYSPGSEPQDNVAGMPNEWLHSPLHPPLLTNRPLFT